MFLDLLCNYLMDFVYEVAHGNEALSEGVNPFIFAERLRVYKVLQSDVTILTNVCDDGLNIFFLQGV